MSTRMLSWLSLAVLLGACTTKVTTFDDGSGGSSSSTSNGSGASSSSSSSSSSGGDDFGACERSSQCILQVPGCCGVCGEPSLDDVEPINSEMADAFFAATCTEDDALCPECAEAPNPNLYAYCETGQCAEADILAASWNTCERNVDCTLRVGTGCCESCNEGDWSTLVAVPTGRSDFFDQICGDEPPPCPACEPAYPSDAAAECIGGACRVVWTQ